MSSAWTHNDGGRAEAGFKGTTGDCVCRAIAIATGMAYHDVYNLIIERAKNEKLPKRHRGGASHPRTGVHKPLIRSIMAELGWTWIPTMGIGTGTTVHLKASELPAGRLVVNVSKHTVAVIDGIVQDTYDSTRGGTRAVYGYFMKLEG